jgi:hypothetical protein
VVSYFGTIQSSPLPLNSSAELAKLVAVTQALELSKGKRVNIFQTCLPDPPHPSSYLEGTWNANCHLRVPVKYSQKIFALLDAVLLPKQVSVIHCPSHQRRDDTIARGN